MDVNLAKFEQYKVDYKKINPVGKVPAMMEEVRKPDGQVERFTMFESHAIMKYICQSRQLADHWYPRNGDAETKAAIDQYLDWHHGAIRMGAGGYFFRAYFSGLMSKDGTWAT